jgi:Acyl-protein synthetase, LuxE
MSMQGDPLRESDALHERALAFVRAFEAKRAMPEPFDALACDIASFQAANIAGFGRLCRANGVTRDSLRVANDIPAVPTDAFKLARVTWFRDEDGLATFLTSGTTVGARGTHRMRRPETYDEAALAFGRWALTSDLHAPPLVLLLGPDRHAAPESSLARMTTLFAERLGAPGAPREISFVKDGVMDLAALDDRVAKASVQGTSVLLLATSFALVHLLDGLSGAHFRLPPGSRVMQTGGFKGRSREVDPADLRSELAGVFGVDERAIVGEYGMTELSSQFYEATLHGGEKGFYVEPPWARIVPVKPETLEPVGEGEVGIARIVDLMNVDSAVVVLTADLVRRKGEGVELLGRAGGATPRGCSIAMDELLGNGGR